MANKMIGHKIELTGVSHRFGGTGGAKPVEALQTTNISIRPGEFLGMVGPSGCGKTTALNMVGGLIKPTEGSVGLDGEAAREGSEEVGYLLARDSLLPWRTALHNVTLSLEVRGMSRRAAKIPAMEMLEMVGLATFADSYPSQLSHGMRQRVAVARTLVTKPRTILMDEPFSALDAETRLKLQGEFLRLWEKLGCTVVFVTHDLAEAIALCDRIVVFSKRPGRIIAEYDIDLERPRNVLELQGNPKYHECFQEIWSIFRKELSEQ